MLSDIDTFMIGILVKGILADINNAWPRWLKEQNEPSLLTGSCEACDAWDTVNITEYLVGAQ